MKMRGRGRGRGMGHMGRGGYKVFVPHIPFDVVMCEQAFPGKKPDSDDEQFTQALVKRNQELTASAEDQTYVLGQVTKVTNALDSLIVMPETDFEVQIQEYRQVGSFKKGTMMIGNIKADIAVILKSLPAKASVKLLAEKILELIKSSGDSENITLVMTDAGFELKSKNTTVNVLVATIPANMSKYDAEVHVDRKLLQACMAAIRHVRWFEENAFHSSVKMLVRLLKDLSRRFEGFNSLTSWIIDLLAHHAVMTTPNHAALPINKAFQRVLKLLSSGFFLPGSAGIVDPCEKGSVRVHTVLTLEQQDKVCFTAQTLLRVLAHGGYKNILGYERHPEKLMTEQSVWKGVVVRPNQQVYEKVEAKEEDASAEGDAKMDTTPEK